MKDLFNQISNGLGGLGGLGDKLNGALGGQQKTDAPSGQGTGNALGDMVKSAGGLGGLLGSAALGGLLGTPQWACCTCSFGRCAGSITAGRREILMRWRICPVLLVS